MHTHNVMHMHGLRSLSANGLSNINKIHIHVITVTFTTSFTLEVFTIFLFMYSFSLQTFKAYLYISNIQSLSISLYLIFRLSLHLLSLQPHSPSLFRHVHYPHLALSSASLTYLLSSVVDPPVSFCFSLSLYFLRTQPIIICRTSLTTVQYISKISQK